MFEDNPEQELVSNDVEIDVYVYANKEDDKTEFGKLIIWT